MAESSHASALPAPRLPPGPSTQAPSQTLGPLDSQSRAAPERPPLEGDGLSFVKYPKHRPFERCPLANKYERVNKVGEGTFGEVFKGKDRVTGEIVALKKIIMKNEQEGFPITAIREIRIMKALNHLNVLSVKEIVHTAASDFNRLKGSIYMVFEYMEHDLGGLLNRGVEFTVPEIKCLTKQLLSGTAYIHKNKIMHRDMKVSNLLLSRTGILKIADFGLARAMEAGENPRYTSTVCTRWYRPMEVLLGMRNYSTAVDIWGVGCIIAELFTGRPILQGGKPGAVSEVDNDLDQFLEIAKLCGSPGPDNWEGFDKVPCGRFAMPVETFPRSTQKRFRKIFRHQCDLGVNIVDAILVLDPKKRPRAEALLNHDFFWVEPLPHQPHEMRSFGLDSHEFTVQPIQQRYAQPKREPGPAPPPGAHAPAPAQAQRPSQPPTHARPPAPTGSVAPGARPPHGAPGYAPTGHHSYSTAAGAGAGPLPPGRSVAPLPGQPSYPLPRQNPALPGVGAAAAAAVGAPRATLPLPTAGTTSSPSVSRGAPSVTATPSPGSRPNSALGTSPRPTLPHSPGPGLVPPRPSPLVAPPSSLRTSIPPPPRPLATNGAAHSHPPSYPPPLPHHPPPHHPPPHHPPPHPAGTPAASSVPPQGRPLEPGSEESAAKRVRPS